MPGHFSLRNTMKVSITGHASGIGKAVSDWLTSRGHEVIGFDLANGYDISDDDVCTQIVEESRDADIFINNAYHDFQQIKLLYLFYDAWADQHRTIVNIGSSRSQFWGHDLYSRSTYPKYYVPSRVALDYACKELWNYQPWPRVMLIKPCGTITPRVTAYPGHNRVPAEDMADIICSAMIDPRCRVQELNLDTNQ